jgi:tetratricopeptide (TPR) repeat protein
MKIALSEKNIALLYDYGKKGRDALQSGDTIKAEEYFLAAWNSLPEPKTEHDYSQSLSRGLVSFYQDTRQFEKAFEWLNTMKSAYNNEPNPSIDFIEATVNYDAGKLNEAFTAFDSLHKKYKARPFQGSDPKYLKFFLENKKGK